MGAFGGYQNEIYVGGLDDVTPELPTDLTRLEVVAEERMPASAFAYVAGSAGSESTARANRAAFERWRIVPRMLRDVSTTDLSVTVLGTPMPAPVALAPVGVLSIVHPEGESAVARAAAALGVPMVVSTAASTSLEDVAAAGGDGPRWYQLYWPKDRELAVSFLDRAAAAGYRALVLTLDTYTMGWRPRDLDNAFLPFLRAIGNRNYFADPVFQDRVGGPIGDENRAAAIAHWAATFGNPTLTWDDLAFLREHWDGPIALKGIQHAGRRPPRCGRRAWTASSSPTTAAARWTAQSRRSTLSRRSSRRSASTWRCSSTAAFARARTSSSRSRSAPGRCSSADPTRTGWGSRARPGCATCCAACSRSWS